jgi:hypothetical protein
MKEVWQSSQSQLHWWRDCWSSQMLIARALERAPIVMTLFVATLLVSVLNEGMGNLLGFADSFLLLCLQLVVANEVWASVSGAARIEHKRDYDQFGTAWTFSWMYVLLLTVAAVCFVIPGLYVAVAACLALPIVCIEHKGVLAALKESHNLVKANFVTSIVYLVPSTLVLVTASIGVWLCVGLTLHVLGAPTEGPIQRASFCAFGLLLSWINLTVVTLQVRLYHHLKQKGITS